MTREEGDTADTAGAPAAATTPVATASDDGKRQRNDGSDEGMLTRGSDAPERVDAEGAAAANSADGTAASSRSTRSISVHEEAETDGGG